DGAASALRSATAPSHARQYSKRDLRFGVSPAWRMSDIHRHAPGRLHPIDVDTDTGGFDLAQRQPDHKYAVCHNCFCLRRIDLGRQNDLTIEFAPRTLLEDLFLPFR